MSRRRRCNDIDDNDNYVVVHNRLRVSDMISKRLNSLLIIATISATFIIDMPTC